MRFVIFMLALLLGQIANAQLSVQEPNPKFIAPYFEKLSNAINTNGPIFIVVKRCGFENAFWDNVSTVVVCQELIENILRKRANAIQTGRIDPQIADMTAKGEAIFVVLHELGHALIDHHKVPFSGREEDTADQFAAYMIMKANDPNAYLGATNFFAEPARMLRIFGKQQLTDEHGLNVQRRAQLVCWGYGRDPVSMQRFAVNVGLSEQRMQRCAEEYQQLMKNTPRLFQAVWQQQK
jgi:hypothetical protein